MITKKEAVLVGKQVILGLEREAANMDSTVLTPSQRGIAMYILDNLWYDVFTIKLKEQFGYDKQQYYRAVGFI